LFFIVAQQPINFVVHKYLKKYKCRIVKEYCKRYDKFLSK